MKNKKKSRALFRVIKTFAKASPLGFALSLLFALISSVVMALTMYSFQLIIDKYIPLVKEAIDNGNTFGEALKTSGYGAFLITIASLLLVSSALEFTGRLIIVNMSQRTMRNLRHQMFSHMQELPISFFDSNKFGDLMSRYTNDTDTIDQFIGNTVPVLASSSLTTITLLIAMIINNPLLALLVLSMVLIVTFLMGFIVSRSSRHFEARQRIVGMNNAYIEEMMEGTRVVQVFNRQKKNEEEFAKINHQFAVEDYKANLLGELIFPLSSNLTKLEFVVVLLLGVLYTMSHPLYTLGMFVAFLTYSNSFSSPIGQISEQFGIMARARAGAERIFDIIDREKETDDGYVTLVNYKLSDNGEIIETKENTHKWAWKHPHHIGGVDYVPLNGDIVLDSVDFSYIEGKQILYDISINAKAGQRVALVGETGAGKTTITNLINRFYDIEDGKIRYDGININKIKKSDLRRSLGLVLQDTNLFTGTIKENIKLGKPDATDEEVVEAAKLANADSFIRMMPQGYDTMLVRAGEQLSQGQRQLLAIARAAIADCPVLILDEATSSIDTRTELIVQKGMDELMKGRTVFVIAHRLSTIQSSDVIMVMDHGRIIESGSHDELIAKKGVYYQLYTGKFEFE